MRMPNEQLSVQLNGRELFSVYMDLTLYLKDAPTAVDVTSAWNVCRDVFPQNELYWVKTTRMNLWHENIDLSRKGALDLYLKEQDSRLDHGVMIRSSRSHGGWSFIIRGVYPKDIGAENCASFCRILLPIGTIPNKVYDMALRLADSLEFTSGHAGFSPIYDPLRKTLAFDYIYVWARRYYGLDIQDISLTLPLVLDSIKGANWLTLIGNSLYGNISPIDDCTLQFDNPITITHCKNGLVIRAGDVPTLGDRNRLEFPTLYAKVENAFWGIKLKKHPEFPGKFEEQDSTMNWFRRLKEPENW